MGFTATIFGTNIVPTNLAFCLTKIPNSRNARYYIENEWTRRFPAKNSTTILIKDHYRHMTWYVTWRHRCAVYVTFLRKEMGFCAGSPCSFMKVSDIFFVASVAFIQTFFLFLFPVWQKNLFVDKISNQINFGTWNNRRKYIFYIFTIQDLQQ